MSHHIHLAIALEPHFIPAITLANGDIAKAMSEPLATDRDEFVYILCSHPRVRLEASSGIGKVYRGRACGEREIGWEATPWAELDLAAMKCEPSTQSRELVRDHRLPAGGGDADLLGTIFEDKLDSGLVKGGRIDLDVRYVGSSLDAALPRAGGEHHATPAALWQALVYSPHAPINVLTCSMQAVTAPAGGTAQRLEPVTRSQESTLAKRLLVEAAEQVLIAEMTPPFNVRNTQVRRFPNSYVGEALAELGFRHVHIWMGLPPDVTLVQAPTSMGGPFQTRTYNLRIP